MGNREWLKHLGFTTATAITTNKIITMKAQEARKLSMSTESEIVKEQMEKVQAEIRKACEDGKYKATFIGELLQGTHTKLTEEGFKVESKSDEDKGMRMYWTEITW